MADRADGIWIIDANAKTLYANSAMAEILGTATDEMIGRSSFAYLYPEDEPADKHLFEGDKSGESSQFHVRLRRQAGGALRRPALPRRCGKGTIDDHASTGRRTRPCPARLAGQLVEDAVVITQEPRVHLWTRDEYYRMAAIGLFDDTRVELIEGQVVEMAAMRSPHSTAVTLAGDALRAVGDRWGAGVWSKRVSPNPSPRVAATRSGARDTAALRCASRLHEKHQFLSA